MKRSTAKPYEGADPYIFVSYSHKDRRFVLPMIERLTRDGYRIWYDEGITPGSYWAEVIADHLSRSSLCIACISENAVASHNCRREISFALLKHKPLLSVFLEKTALTPGIEMQLTANQCIFTYEYPDVAKCLSLVKSTPGIAPCLGDPDTSVEVCSPNDYLENGQKNEGDTIDISDEWFGVKKRTPAGIPKQETEMILIRKSTDETIDPGDSLYIGRVGDSSSNCFVIADNPEISRKHFSIDKKNGEYFVTDKESKNGTFLNGTAIPQEEPIKLSAGDEIRASKEIFVCQEKN